VFWSAQEVDIKYISNVYSNVDSAYSDSYSQVITFTHSGEWPANSKPDLNINMTLQGGDEAVPGDVMPFTITVGNSGNKYSWGGNVALYRSSDQIFDTGFGSDDVGLVDNYNDFFEIPYLMPGDTKAFAGSLVMPSESGTYYFTAFADVRDNISESNENNNQSQVFSVTVGDAQATADVTYPIIGENTDLSDLHYNNNRYIEVTYSDAKPDSIDNNEIVVLFFHFICYCFTKFTIDMLMCHLDVFSQKLLLYIIYYNSVCGLFLFMDEVLMCFFSFVVCKIGV